MGSSLAVIVLASACSNETKSCNGMGCFHGASFSGEVAHVSGPVHLAFCINGACVFGDGYAAAKSCTAFGTDPASVDFCFESETASGTWKVSGYVDLATTHAKDGDRYVFTVRDGQSGATLGTADENVQYHDYSPNGAECGPTCKRSEFSIAPP